MYEVLFSPGSCTYQASIFTTANFATAIEFALQLHGVSNVPHEIIVFDNETDESRLTLTL